MKTYFIDAVQSMIVIVKEWFQRADNVFLVIRPNAIDLLIFILGIGVVSQPPIV